MVEGPWKGKGRDVSEDPQEVTDVTVKEERMTSNRERR